MQSPYFILREANIAGLISDPEMATYLATMDPVDAFHIRAWNAEHAIHSED